MRNYVQPGESIEFTAPGGGVVAGVPVQIGQLVVVPAVSALENTRFVGMTRGVFTVPKQGSQAWTEGAVVYWTGSVFTTTASTNLQAGTAVQAVGSGPGETTGVVRLDGVARPSA